MLEEFHEKVSNFIQAIYMNTFQVLSHEIVCKLILMNTTLPLIGLPILTVTIMKNDYQTSDCSLQGLSRFIPAK